MGFKKIDFSTGGWLVGSRPKSLLILGDHLFFSYIFLGRQWWLINPAGLINPNLIFQGDAGTASVKHGGKRRVGTPKQNWIQY
jgi:hypothetical protein